jgi:Phage P22-like portal protein
MNVFDPDGEKSVVDIARERFQKAKAAYSTSRQEAVEDIRFVLGDGDNGWQWFDYVRNERESQRRATLTVNVTAQHCNQVINAIRQNRPQARVLPADSFADKKTAELLGGLIRNIQTASNADSAHDNAAQFSVWGGEGYWRVRTDYESPSSFNQTIKIEPILNPFLVYVDPYCRTMDKADAEWGFVFEDIPKSQAIREHPDIQPDSWIDDPGGWVAKDTVRRAEYFYCEWVKDEALLLIDGSSVLKSEADKMPGYEAFVVKRRPTEVRKWKWCKLVGGETEPVDSRDWPGSYLPIVQVIGVEVNVNGEIVRKGLVRDLKDPARMLNYAYSAAIETIALQNKVPYMIAAEAVQGHETDWGTANTENLAYLTWNARDDEGNELPKPERQQPSVMPTAQVQMLQLSTEQMRAASGQQSANFGIRSEAQSGIGIQRLKQQGEVATFHFPDNLARALRYEAMLLLDLIPKVYDTKRVVRILGLDGRAEQATLDPAAQASYAEEYAGIEKDVSRIFNPQMGSYDVVIDTGPSYATQRQEAFTALTDLAGRRPELMQVAGDIIMRAADFPMAEQLAERLEKTLPPNLLDQKGQKPVPPEAQAQINQLTQQAQQMSQMLDDAQAELQKGDAMKGEAAMQKMQADAQLKSRELDLREQELMIEDYRAQTERATAQANAEVAAQEAEKAEAVEPEVGEDGQPAQSAEQMLLQAFMQTLEQMQASSMQQANTNAQAVAAMLEAQAQTQQAVETLAMTAAAPKDIVVGRDSDGTLRGRVVPTLQ